MVSTKGGLTLRVVTAKTGLMAWEYTWDAVLAQDQPPVHVAFLESGGTDVVIAAGGGVHRVRGGDLLWTWTPDEPQKVLYVVPYDKLLYVVGAARDGNVWRPCITVLTYNADTQAIHHVSGAFRDLWEIVLLPYQPRRHIPEVWHATPSGGPHIVWSGSDGAVYALRLNAPTPQPAKLTARQGIFTGVQNVQLGDRGFFVGRRSDHTAEVLQVDVDGTLRSVWEFEEVAPDAVYDGTFDRQGKAYVLRMYFTLAQHLMNQHVFWADAQSGGYRGQVTGYSYQYDHDRHGNLRAAAVEVMPLAPTRLAVRVAVVTSSGSIQMLLDSEQQWVLEQGLAQPRHALLVPLPDARLGPAAVSLAAAKHAAPASTPYDLLTHESVVARWVRHLGGVARVPLRVMEAVRHWATDDNAGVEAQMQALLGFRRATRLSAPIAGGPRMAGSNEPMEAPRQVPNATLHHDRFGFHTLALIASQQGKVYGINQTLDGSRIVWERSLVGFGGAEGAPEPEVDVTRLVLLRTAQAAAPKPPLAPLAAVVAEVSMPGAPRETRVWHFDPLTGEFAGTADGEIACRGAARDVFHMDAQLVVVCDDGTVAPVRGGVPTPLYLATSEKHALQGYVLDTDMAPTWRMPFAPTERIVAMQDATTDAVASLGKVRGDRSVLYKYLNPHARLVVTHDAQQRAAQVYLVDVVSGDVVYRLRVPDVASDAMHATLAENWITVQYTSTDARTPERIVSIELFESTPPAPARLKTDSPRSSSAWSAHAPPTAYVQTFVLPYSVRATGTTRTTLGVATRSLIVATNRSEVVLVPRHFLNPRRPLGKPSAQDQEEGLIPYHPMIPDEPTWYLTKEHHLGARLTDIVTAPALLESSSMVLATGLDWVYTVASPSGPFDRLRTSFDKMQLVLTISGLLVGIAITQPLVRRRTLQARW